MRQLLELYQFAESANIAVDLFQLPETEAITLQIGGRYYIGIDPDRISGTADEKEKLAHELGHCVTGCVYSRYCLYELAGRCENRAQKWAIKKLIPKDELYELYKNGYVEPWQIAEIKTLPEDFVKKAMEYYHEQEQACSPETLSKTGAAAG